MRLKTSWNQTSSCENYVLKFMIKDLKTYFISFFNVSKKRRKIKISKFFEIKQALFILFLQKCEANEQTLIGQSMFTYKINFWICTVLIIFKS